MNEEFTSATHGTAATHETEQALPSPKTTARGEPGRLKPWLYALLVLASATALVRYASERPARAYTGPTTSVKRGNLVERTVVVGRIVPRTEVHVRPTISGVLGQLLVEPGDRVEPGQHVATVVPVADPVSLSNAESRVTQAKLRLATAEREYGRRNVASKLGGFVVSAQEVARAKDDVELARTELSAAERARRLIANGSTQARGQASTRIVTPIAGTVLHVPVVVGTFVAGTSAFRDGTSVAVVADMDDLVFKGQVDEAHVEALTPGDELQVRVGARSEASLVARLEQVAPRAHVRESRFGVELAGGVTTFEIRAALPPGTELRAGYSATADVVVAARNNVLLVDEGALGFRHGEAYVEQLLADGTLHPRKVRIGKSDGVRAEIVQGLREGDIAALVLEREGGPSL